MAHAACQNCRVADHDAVAPSSESPQPNGAPPPSCEAATSPAPVTIEDRNRYGLLLDKAAERGLLTAADYEARLRDLGEATSTEEMLAIVTDLPAFARPMASSAGRRGSRPPTPPGAHPLAGSPAPATGVTRSQRRRPWVMLVVLVVVVVLTLVVLGLSVGHLHRSPPTGDPRSSARVSAQRPSPLRNCSSSAAISSPLGSSTSSTGASGS